jgi:hypothetical protein
MAWMITGSSPSKSRTPTSKERAVAVRADEHQNLIHVETLHRIANSVEHVIVIYTMLSGWFADPHPDNLPCLRGRVKRSCLSSCLGLTSSTTARHRRHCVGARTRRTPDRERSLACSGCSPRLGAPAARSAEGHDRGRCRGCRAHCSLRLGRFLKAVSASRVGSRVGAASESGSERGRAFGCRAGVEVSARGGQL